MKEQLEKYLQAIKQDYLDWNAESGNVYDLSDVKLQMIKDFGEKLRYTEGKSYFKVISGTSVHSFIVKEDGKKFKKGDILKAAGWKAPAKNKARGNIFATYQIRWTGPNYLR